MLNSHIKKKSFGRDLSGLKFNFGLSKISPNGVCKSLKDVIYDSNHTFVTSYKGMVTTLTFQIYYKNVQFFRQ